MTLPGFRRSGLDRAEIVAPPEAREVIDGLHRAITTAANDDMSEAGSELRKRHVQRMTAMMDAVETIEQLKAVTK